MSMRATISKVDVITIANELNEAGVTPTATNIRKKLGRGSFTTIQNFLEEWRKEAGPLEEKADVPAELQRYLVTLATELWQIAKTEAREDLAKARDAMRHEQMLLMKRVDEALTTTEVVKESATTFEHELRQLQNRYQQAQTELALSRQEATNLLRERQRGDERIDELETENERLQRQLATTERDLSKVTASEQTYRSRYTDTKAQLEQQKASLERLNDQLDQLTTAHRKVTAERDDALANAQRARDERSDMQQEMAVTQQRFTDIQSRYHQLHKAHSDLVNQAAAHEANATQLERQLEQKKTAVESLQGEIEKLQQAHYEQTGQLTAVTSELRYAQRALYLRDKSSTDE